MAVELSTARRPGGRLSIYILATVLVALLACAILYFAVLQQPEGRPLALSGPKIDAAISDILATLVSISGITVPLIIAYLLVKEKELDFFFIERAVDFLEHHGWTLRACRAAYLTLSDATKPGKASEEFRILIEITNLTSEEELTSASQAALAQVIPDTVVLQQYLGCFSSSQDRDALKGCIWFIGLSAGYCFVDLYLRVFGFSGWLFDIVEQFGIVCTVGANVTAYVLMVSFVQMKNTIKRQSTGQVRRICRKVVEDMASASVISDNLRGVLANEFESEKLSAAQFGPSKPRPARKRPDAGR